MEGIWKIRRPRPSPRQGRRLGPPQVWNLSFLATGIPRPHQWLLLGVQACRLPRLKRFKGFKSLQARPETLQRLQTVTCINGFSWASSAGKSYPKARSIAFSSQGHINGFFWASKPAVCHALNASKASNRYKPGLKRFKGFKPWRASMASYGLPAQAKATPRPDPLLFLGGPACRWPGIRSQQASQGHIHGFLWASKLAVCQPFNA